MKSYIAPSRSWRSVSREFDMTCLAVIVLFGVGVCVVDFSTAVPQAQRPIFPYDPTTAYPRVDNDMPFWVALVVPFLVLLATASVMEFVVLKQGAVKATVAFVNVLLSCLAAVAVVGFLTELFKRICGRLRPDFQDRCRPDFTGSLADISYGSYPNVNCTGTDMDILNDGHMSFPSGHSSCSMAFGLFSALYLLWCLHWRNNGTVKTALLSPADSCVSKILKELANLALILLVLFDVAWPWGVAASRFRDNKHNVSDVVGGLLLAASFVPIFVVRLADNSGHFASQHALDGPVDNDPILPIAGSPVVPVTSSMA